ncbi:MAG: lipid-A-disaccharide synthase, partial [Nitrospirae bacterium]|nr:lipid-A-disaccharide synthase [Nitrospirota bacterium]
MLERVMIISGESSGELYGALLARALKSRNPEMRIVGVGGDRMESAGVEFISRISSSFGLTEAIKTYGEIRKTFRKVVSAFKSFSPQVVVLIDYPDFNIRVAREAKRLGIRVLYYVSPQVWAWRMKRVKTIAELVDMMAVILPFEVDIYRQTDVRCEFVGHPVMDEITEVVQDSGFGIADIGSAGLKSRGKNELGLLPDKPVMALMPGSRLHEVEKLLPVMADVATEMKRRYPDYQFVMPLAPNLDEALFPRYISEIFHVVKGRSIKALLSSDIALIASGTSTLQAALLGIPTVVIYKLSPLTYFIGKLIVKVKHISLVNILLDKSVEDDSGLRIRELLQADANKENIMSELVKISDD